MILRKPTFQDVYKGSLFLSNDEQEQRLILQEWLNQLQNPNFFSWVIVKDHNVIAVVSGLHDPGSATTFIGRLVGEERFRNKLISKLKKALDPEKIILTVKDLDQVVADHDFKVESYNLLYNKNVVTTQVDEVVTDEDNQSEAEGND